MKKINNNTIDSFRWTQRGSFSWLSAGIHPNDFLICRFPLFPEKLMSCLSPLFSMGFQRVNSSVLLMCSLLGSWFWHSFLIMKSLELIWYLCPMPSVTVNKKGAWRKISSTVLQVQKQQEQQYITSYPCHLRSTVSSRTIEWQGLRWHFSDWISLQKPH